MELSSVIDEIVLHTLLKDAGISGTLFKTYQCVYNRPLGTVTEYATYCGMPRETFRTAVAKLMDLGWILPLSEKSRGRIVMAWMPHRVEETVVARLIQVKEDVPYFGEWLMGCFLDLMVDDRRYESQARPKWLVSGAGDGRMELDRWYKEANVAFEFQGSQHYRPGDLHSEKELVKQRARDQLKLGVCARVGVRVVEVTLYDLAFPSLREKIGDLLPTRPVFEDRPLARALKQLAHGYINTMARRLQHEANRQEQ